MRQTALKALERDKKDAIVSIRLPFAVLEMFRREFGSPSEAARIMIREYLALRAKQGKRRNRAEMEEFIELLRRCPGVVPSKALYPALETIRALYVAYSGGEPGPHEAQAVLKPVIEVAQRVMDPKGRAA